MQTGRLYLLENIRRFRYRIKKKIVQTCITMFIIFCMTSNLTIYLLYTTLLIIADKQRNFNFFFQEIIFL